ncbi:MAG: type I glyceraldehyde-3-phosphate dehydrogenase [Candidatus Pacebacteria bacterium]|nr:type I glyceraldehyde-3-phosphate dehydrogenase [Candidatus Paceibacterota bacterium]
MNIAINGFGRIGRLLCRQLWGRPDVHIVAINDLGDVANLAYLLKHDSVYRAWDHDVVGYPDKAMLVIDNKEIQFFNEKDPAQLPWKKLGIDVVVESTGVFESFEKAKIHLDAGAKRVLITAPAKDADTAIGKTVLMGLNEQQLAECQISSNASCTTNGASPLIAVLSETIGVEKAILSTVHAYTATQSIVDGPVKGEDYRRGRAAAQNIIPSTTGAATAVTRAFPQLEGLFDGIAIRVPVVSGSLIDITFVAKKETTSAEINSILTAASKEPRWKGLLEVSTQHLVSSDIIGINCASLVDLTFTKVVGGNLVKVLAWYDNEWGYATTLVKHLEAITHAL